MFKPQTDWSHIYIYHKHYSTAVLDLPLIQVEQLSIISSYFLNI